MKKEHFKILIGVILLMAGTLCACKGEDANESKSPANKIKVTYIANAGYLIESSDHKILIDALFTESFRLYSTPSTEICNKIINGDAPFDNVKALFITHTHRDHFSPSLVKKFIESNENRYVICSDTIRKILEVKFGTDKYQLYKDRIRGITPEIFSSIDSNVDDLEFTIMRLRHSGESEEDKNLGYLISMNGINIFHSGDNDGHIAAGQSIDGIEEYLKLNIDKERIDIAIVNRGMFWDKTAPGIEIIKNYIRPEVVILAHLSKNDAQRELGSVMDVLKEYKNDIASVVILENSLDSKIFAF